MISLLFGISKGLFSRNFIGKKGLFKRILIASIQGFYRGSIPYFLRHFVLKKIDQPAICIDYCLCNISEVILWLSIDF